VCVQVQRHANDDKCVQLVAVTAEVPRPLLLARSQASKAGASAAPHGQDNITDSSASLPVPTAASTAQSPSQAQAHSYPFLVKCASKDDANKLWDTLTKLAKLRNMVQPPPANASNLNVLPVESLSTSN
jgi:hypothetical protein